MATSMQALLSLFGNKETPPPPPPSPKLAAEQPLRLRSSFRNTAFPAPPGNGTRLKKTVRMILPPPSPPTVVIPVAGRQHDFVYSQRRGGIPPAPNPLSFQQSRAVAPHKPDGYNHTFEARYAGPSIPNANDAFMAMIKRRAEGNSGLKMVVDTQGHVPTIRWQGCPAPCVEEHTGSDRSADRSRRSATPQHRSLPVPRSELLIRESTFDPRPSLVKAYPTARDWSTMSAVTGSVGTMNRTAISAPRPLVMQTPLLRVGHAAAAPLSGANYHNRRPPAVKLPTLTPPSGREICATRRITAVFHYILGPGCFEEITYCFIAFSGANHAKQKTCPSQGHRKQSARSSTTAVSHPGQGAAKPSRQSASGDAESAFTSRQSIFDDDIVNHSPSCDSWKV